MLWERQAGFSAEAQQPCVGLGKFGSREALALALVEAWYVGKVCVWRADSRRSIGSDDSGSWCRCWFVRRVWHGCNSAAGPVGVGFSRGCAVVRQAGPASQAHCTRGCRLLAAIYSPRPPPARLGDVASCEAVGASIGRRALTAAGRFKTGCVKAAHLTAPVLASKKLSLRPQTNNLDMVSHPLLQSTELLTPLSMTQPTPRGQWRAANQAGDVPGAGK